MLLCVDFCGGYSFLMNYSVGLEKAGVRVKHKSAIFEKGRRPIFIKITFLESAHHQLSNGICGFF